MSGETCPGGGDLYPLLLAAIYGVSPVWPIILPIIIAALSMIAVHEALWSTSFLKHPRISGYSILLAGLIPFWVYYDGRPLPALCGLFVYVLLLFCEAIASRKRITLEKDGRGVFPVGLHPLFPVLLPAHPPDGQLGGAGGAAFYRGLYQRRVRPVCRHGVRQAQAGAGALAQKTVEGAVGGFAGAVVCSVLYGALLQFAFRWQVSYAALALYGALGSVVSQLGTCPSPISSGNTASRTFGNIFPGHGGVLDRFDSVIFCAPLIELLIRILPAVGVGA